MQLKEERLCAQIGFGWLILLLLLLSMLVCMILDSAISGNFTPLAKDPGALGLKHLVVVMALYALFPVLTYLIQGSGMRKLRWVIVTFSILFLLYFLAHHAGHWIRGERPNFISHILDIAHHLAALWLIVSSVKWARFPASNSESVGS